MKLLDLCCCAGGASTGYAQAGFDVTGVDIADQPRYPFRFIWTDALEYLVEHGHEYDVIAGSPPCQMYSQALKHMSAPQPMLIEPMQQILDSIGRPYIIENVEGAPLLRQASLFGGNGVMLCGTMFGMRIYRHRLFETNWPVPAPAKICDHRVKAMNPHNALAREDMYREFGRQDPEILWRREMGVEWMGRYEAREAIPPAYTKWLGLELMSHLGSVAA